MALTMPRDVTEFDREDALAHRPSFGAPDTGPPIGLPDDEPQLLDQENAPHFHPAGLAVGEGGGDGVLRLYLRDIAAAPLLTREQEIALARRIEAGERAHRALVGEPRQTGAELARLERYVKDGEQAMQTFVRSNLRLVVGCVRTGTTGIVDARGGRPEPAGPAVKRRPTHP